MTNTNITNDVILEEIRKSRQELKLQIEAVEVKILLKVEEVSRRITEVEKENKNIENRLEYFERRQKKNNIIIFGLKQVQQISSEQICDELKKLTGITVYLSDLNDVYPLGKQENSPIKVEFLYNLKKRSVLQNTHLLKGSNISIFNDLTPAQRAENKVLRKHLYIAKQNKQNTCFIKKNKLYINNEVYTAGDLNLLREESFEEVKSKSAPGTPINAPKRKQEEQPKENKGKISKSSDTANSKTPEPGPLIPTGNKFSKREDTKQAEKQEEKRKTRSGSTSTMMK